MRKVLFVYQSDDDADLYTVGLSMAGIEVTAVTPVQAVMAASVRAVDAVVISCSLEDETGWRVCRLLHTVTAPDTPLVLLTAWVREDGLYRSRAREVGCAAFVAKPCTPERLATVIERVCAGERGIESVRL